MTTLLNFACLTYRELSLEKMRLRGIALGLKLEQKLEGALQFSYSHVTREGLTVKLMLSCEKIGSDTLRIPPSPVALFMTQEDHMLLSGKPVLSVSFFAKTPSEAIPEAYRPAYEEATDKLEFVLSNIERGA